MTHLRTLTEVILSGKKNFGELDDTIIAIQDIYTAHIGVNAGAFSEDGIRLPSGLAISPAQAADCLVITPQRTAVFLRGIYRAILDSLEKYPGQTINILYAGCGPYAALLTPLTTFFSPDQVSFYLLDINKECIDSVQKLFSSMGALSYVKEFICADAAVYCLPDIPVMHIVISETMQRILHQEPQVAIMQNLIPQMEAGTFFIPEEIVISLKLITPADARKNDETGNYQPKHIDLGDLYVIGRHKYGQHATTVVQMPADPGEFTSLNMFTDITVYADQRLTTYNCTLNAPLKIADIDEIRGAWFRFTYQNNDRPGFIHEWFW